MCDTPLTACTSEPSTAACRQLRAVSGMSHMGMGMWHVHRHVTGARACACACACMCSDTCTCTCTCTCHMCMHMLRRCDMPSAACACVAQHLWPRQGYARLQGVRRTRLTRLSRGPCARACAVTSVVMQKNGAGTPTATPTLPLPVPLPLFIPLPLPLFIPLPLPLPLLLPLPQGCTRPRLASGITRAMVRSPPLPSPPLHPTLPTHLLH